VRPAAIIFDLDGTLVDDESAVAAGLSAFHAVHGPTLGLTLLELRPRWLELFQQHFNRYLSGQVSMQEQRRLRMRDLFAASGRCLTDHEADFAFSSYRHAYTAGWRTFPEVPQALNELHGFRLAVLTNGNGDQQRAKLAAAGIAEQFEAIFVSSEIGVAKPDQAAFRRAATHLGVREADCLFIGDNLDVDIRGAARAGMDAILVDRRLDPAMHTSAVVAVSSLLEVVAIVRGHKV